MSEQTPIDRLATTVAARPSANQDSSPSPFEGREFPFAFGRYVIQKKLGQGAMGAVFLALDTELKNRPVALKVPQLRQRDSTTAIERFRREAGTAALLRHPNICKILDVNTQDSIHYLTMDYEAGQTLQAYLEQNGPVRNEQAAEWIRKIAAALEVAHQNRVLHRDLKPSNILLRKQTLEPVILDFGLARHDAPDDLRLTMSGESPGTPAYMSPEQFAGEPDKVQAPSDLFSLGVILYEMLSGERPFKGKSASAIYLQIAVSEPEPLTEIRPSVDPGLAAICHQLLNKNPQRRYASARALADALAEWQKKQTPLSTSAPSKKVLFEWAGLAAVVLVAAFGVTRMLRPSPTENTPSDVPLSRALKAPAQQETKPLNNDSTADERVQVIQSGGVSTSSIPPALEIHLQRAADSSGYRRVTNQDVPIHDGDKLHLHVTLPEPRFIYLFWFDAEGIPVRFWPESPEHQQPTHEIWSPPRTDDPARQVWHKMGGATGVEMILAAASVEPLTPEELASFQQSRLTMALSEQDQLGIEPEPARDSRAPAETGTTLTVLTLPKSAEREVVLVTSVDRPRVRGATGLVVSPKATSAQSFAARLSHHFQSYSGVVFPHAK